MKKNINNLQIKIPTIVFIVFFSAIFPLISSAQGTLFLEENVVVPSSCSVFDTSGNVHNFPKDNSPSGLLGICAIVSAKDAGIINSFEFIDFGFGLFLNSINGIATSPDWDLSWSLYHNDNFAMVGLADLVVKEGDKISLVYTSFSTGQEFDKVILHLVSQGELSNSSENGVGVAFSNFNVDKAARFLLSKSNSQEFLGNPIFTDWSVIALSSHYALTGDNNSYSVLEFLKKYFLQNIDPGESLASPVLSYIRRAMALMALGINPYFGTEVNYIQKIVESFDGTQVGDPEIVNDDIFSLIVLKKAGFELEDEIIQKTLLFVLSNQKEDGSWVGGVDMTAAAIQALSLFSNINEVQGALLKARTYLAGQQSDDGGFGSPDSTSWTMQAIAVMGEDWRNWRKNGRTPADYMLSVQKEDGSINSSLPIWSTAYAIPAGIGKSWGMILKDFSKTDAEIYFANKKKEAELQRITQELSEIKKEALVLEQKVYLLAQQEKENILARGDNQNIILQENKNTIEEETSSNSVNKKENKIQNLFLAQIREFTESLFIFLKKKIWVNK